MNHCYHYRIIHLNRRVFWRGHYETERWFHQYLHIYTCPHGILVPKCTDVNVLLSTKWVDVSIVQYIDYWLIVFKDLCYRYRVIVLHYHETATYRTSSKDILIDGIVSSIIIVNIFVIAIIIVIKSTKEIVKSIFLRDKQIALQS